MKTPSIGAIAIRSPNKKRTKYHHAGHRVRCRVLNYIVKQRSRQAQHRRTARAQAQHKLSDRRQNLSDRRQNVMSGHEVPGPERDAMAEGQSGMPYPESRKPPGGSRDGHHHQDPGELRHAVKRAAPQRRRCAPRSGGVTRHGDRLDKAGQPGGPVSAVYSPAAA